MELINHDCRYPVVSNALIASFHRPDRRLSVVTDDANPSGIQLIDPLAVRPEKVAHALARIKADGYEWTPEVEHAVVSRVAAEIDL